MESIDVKPEQGKRKRGEVRGDGRIFWRYKSDGREVWILPEKAEEIRVKERAAAKKSKDKAKTKDELLKLFHFSNLQPLWRWDNRLKRDKMPDELK